MFVLLAAAALAGPAPALALDKSNFSANDCDFDELDLPVDD
jgi:hypothetical protein